MATNWSINYLIADLLGGGATTKPEPREEIWASDLGKPLFDTWHKMKGIEYTNPADGRGMITFLLGKAIEQGVYNMLNDCGIVYDSQEKVRVETEGNLPVTGRPDLIIEVKDWTKVIANIDKLSKRDYRLEGLKTVIGRYSVQYPEGLKAMPFEIKSINSMALKYNKLKGMANAYPFHHFQLYTYMKAKGYPEGHLLYIAKDTGYMEEVIVKATKELDDRWLNEVTRISNAFRSDNSPKPLPLEVNGKKNWEVEYSPYKDLIYLNAQSQELPTIVIDDVVEDSIESTY